jgi:hypothetical protein
MDGVDPSGPSASLASELASYLLPGSLPEIGLTSPAERDSQGIISLPSEGVLNCARIESLTSTHDMACDRGLVRPPDEAARGTQLVALKSATSQPALSAF